MQVQEVSTADSNDYITFYKLHFLVKTFIEKWYDLVLLSTNTNIKKIIKSLSTPVYT